MIPNNATPARRAARRECLLHDLMGDLAAQERTEAFEGRAPSGMRWRPLSIGKPGTPTASLSGRSWTASGRPVSP